MAQQPVAQLIPFTRAWSYLRWITPETAEAMVAAAWSDAQAQRRLFDTMLQTDPDIRAAVRARVMALSVAEWFITYDDGEQVIPNGIAKAVEHLMLGMLYGAAAVELIWGQNGRLVALETWPLSSLTIRDGEPYLLIKQREPVRVADVADRVAVITADPHDPAQAAELRPIVTLWLSRLYLLRDWRRYLERFADPLIVTAPPEHVTEIAGQEATEVLANAVAKAKTSGVLAVPFGTSTELLNDSRSDASNAFSALWDTSTELVYRGVIGDTEIILGGPDGSRAATEVRYRQLDALAERDAELVRQALQKSLNAALQNSGMTATVGYTWRRELTTSQLADLYLRATQAGIPFDPFEAAKQLGLPLSEATMEMGRILRAARQVPRRGAKIKDELDRFAAQQARRFAARALAHYTARAKELTQSGPHGLDALKPDDDPPQALVEALKHALNGTILGALDSHAAD